MKLQFVAKKPSHKDYPKELNTLGDHLRKVRLDRNMPQSDVAQTIGVDTDTITSWELNRNEPTAKFAKKLVEFIGYVPIEWQQSPFSRKVFYARLLGGLTQKELAKKTGLGSTTIQKVESGNSSPSKKTLLALSSFLD